MSNGTFEFTKDEAASIGAALTFVLAVGLVPELAKESHYTALDKILPGASEAVKAAQASGARG